MQFDKAKKMVLINLVLEMISKAKISNNEIIYTDTYVVLIKLAQEFTKLKQLEINGPDVMRIFIEKFQATFNEKQKENGNSSMAECSFEDFIGGNEAAKLLADDIIMFFESIPRIYSIIVKLPSITNNFFIDKKLSEDLGFIYSTSSGDPLGLSLAFAPQGGLFQTSLTPVGSSVLSLGTETSRPLEVRTSLPTRVNALGSAISGLLNYETKVVAIEINNIKGFVGDISSNTWTKIYLTIKKIIISGLYSGVIKINKNNIILNNLPYMRSWSAMNVNALDVQSQKQISIELPYELVSMLYQIELSDSVVNNTQQLNSSFDVFKKYVSCMQLGNEYVSRIETAISWAFEAELSNNDTFSYIQTFLGLEAMLGFDSPIESELVKKLAIRCAYLIANNHQERNQLHKDFIELYSIRSKLVHGMTANLEQNEKQKLLYAKELLKRVIVRELSLLA